MKFISTFNEFIMSDYATNIKKYIRYFIIISIIQFIISIFLTESILANIAFLVWFIANLKLIYMIIKSYKEFCK